MIRAHGVDVSHWNPPGIPAGRVRFLIAKASEGTHYADPAYAGYRSAAAAAGKHFGAYHFARPDTGTDPTAEADWFITCAQPAAGDLAVLDIEVRGPSPAAWVNTWCTQVAQRTGATPIVYTNLSVGDTLAGCGDRPLWIADPSRPAGSPRLPGPWRSWVVHQYGIAGGVDRDIAAGRYADVLARLAVPAPASNTAPAAIRHRRRLILIGRIQTLLDRLRARS